jgi:hypothetical protein
MSKLVTVLNALASSRGRDPKGPYYLCYDRLSKRWFAAYESSRKIPGTMCFSDLHDCEDAISKLGDDLNVLLE